MPIKRQDTTRALELLEDYHRKLNSPEDIQLRSAIERVIKIFKSKLFNALLEIQEFYEATLLDESKSTEEKTLETMKVAERWANSQGLVGPPSSYPAHSAFSSLGRMQVLLPEQQQQQQNFQPADFFDPFSSSSAVAASNGSHGSNHQLAAQRGQPTPPPPPPPPPHDVQHQHQQHQQQAFTVVLERSGHGFGFSIAGGSDAPHAAPDDPRIRVTRLVPGGAADSRLQVGDALLAVNGIDVSCVTHAEAVEALRLAGSRLRLLVLRGGEAGESQPEPRELRVLLNKTVRGLGFSIAGGLHNEHLPGDCGIFITKLIDGGAAQLDGRVSAGDRLVSVNGAPLSRVTHEEAVAALKRTGSEVLLSVVKPSAEELAALMGMEAEAEAAEAAAALVQQQLLSPPLPPPVSVDLQQQQQQQQQQPALEFAPDKHIKVSLLYDLPSRPDIQKKGSDSTFGLSVVGGCLYYRPQEASSR